MQVALQYAMSERLTGRRHVLLLGKYETMAQHADSKVAAQEHLARLFGVQHCVATARLNVVPTKDSRGIDDTTVQAALRFMLGEPPEQTYFRYVCGYRGSAHPHAMTSGKLSGHLTWRHNHVHALMRHPGAKAGLDGMVSRGGPHEGQGIQ